MASLLEEGLPATDHIYVDLGHSVSNRIHLFPEEKVTVFAPNSNLKRVDVGAEWEGYAPQKVFLVRGIAGQPVTARFAGSGALKVETRYKKNRDRKRDIHPANAPVYKK